MLVAFDYSHIFQSLFGKLFGKTSAQITKLLPLSAEPAADPGLLVPSLFVKRDVQNRPIADAWDFSSESALRQVLAERLDMVGARYVPRSRVGARAKPAGGAGKAMPRKGPHVLRRYKQERTVGAFSLPKAPRVLMPPSVSVPACVVRLADVRKRSRGVLLDLASGYRLAA